MYDTAVYSCVGTLPLLKDSSGLLVEASDKATYDIVDIFYCKHCDNKNATMNVSFINMCSLPAAKKFTNFLHNVLGK